MTPSRAHWIATAAVFGALWAASETTLGLLLRYLGIPLRGTLMTGIGAIIVLTARRNLTGAGWGGRGVCLAVGAVTASLVPLAVSGRAAMPMTMVGIMLESACMELVLFAGRPGRLRFGLAGMLAAMVPNCQRLGYMMLQYGFAAAKTFEEFEKLLSKEGTTKLGLAGWTFASLFSLVMTLAALYGLACGLLAWSISQKVLIRLGRDVGR